MNDIPDIHRLYLEEMGLEKKSDVSTPTWNILNVIDTILNEKNIKL